MERDKAILLDIDRAARLVEEFICGLDKPTFLEDLKTQSAVLHHRTTELGSLGKLRYKAMNAKIVDVSYEKDFYAWAIHNAGLLKQGRIAEIDIKNIAEELESMGKRDKRQIVNRLIVLLVRMLKWEFQKENRSSGWKGSMIEQRRRMNQLLEDSPSLNNELDTKLDYAYAEALKQASIETGLDQSVFPSQCPYSKEQLLDDEFYP